MRANSVRATRPLEAEDCEVKRQRVGKRYQADIPEFKGHPFHNEDNPKRIDMLLWSPHHSISETDLKEYLIAATSAFNLKEDEALSYLCFYDFDLRKAYWLMQTISIYRYNVLTQDKAHFERFAFTEHKLDSIKSIFQGSIMDHLFMYYYTKQTFHSKSYLDCLVLHNEENTPVLQYFINYAEYSRLDLKDDYIFNGRILDITAKTIVSNIMNPTFEISNMPLLQNIRLEIEKNIRQIQKHKQMIFEKVLTLRLSKAKFFDYQMRINQAKLSSKWNRIEIILLIECLRVHKNDLVKIATVMRTKSEQQIRQFQTRHAVFLDTVSQVCDNKLKHRLVKQYLLRPIIERKVGLHPLSPIATTSNLSTQPTACQPTLTLSDSC